MGNANSKPIVEDNVALNISLLQRAGALVDGAQGILQWATYFRHGENSLRYHMGENALYISYRLCGQIVSQLIEIDYIPLYWNHGTSRPRFICPACERGAYIIYTTNRQVYMRCRRCSNLSYESQIHHYGKEVYLLWRDEREQRRHHDAWLAHERKKAARRKSCVIT